MFDSNHLIDIDFTILPMALFSPLQGGTIFDIEFGRLYHRKMLLETME